MTGVLAAGARLGPYEILAPLGAGGMGEVYKARDTRLNRVVAIKVLPPHLADRPDVRERFEREARTIAGLSHPHICVLYDVGEQDGAYFLVMEHVEGETLADRLAKGPLPVDQVLHYAAELADALDRAHRQGVLHRDIKPGNIMLTGAGCKLLDFGLAKLKESDLPNIFLSQRHTEPNVLTDQGMILGTLQYMAPEQVEGKIDELDARTDIFAFGAVVYEMATGRKAFDGKSQASIMAAILKEDPPPMSGIQALTPPALERVVRKCLAKEPEKRWQTASDLRDSLTWIADESSSPRVLPTPVPTFAARRLRDRLPWAVAALAVLGVAALAIPYFRASPTDAPVIRFPISPPGDAVQAASTQLAISPDGTRVAFKAREGSSATALVWVRWLDSPTIRPVAGTEGVTITTLFWSPDGRFLGFVSGGKLKIVPVSGGPVIPLADAYPRAGAWSRDGTILFTPTRLGGLARISSAGGAPSPVTTRNLSRGERYHRYPQFLPDGRHFLYFVASDNPDTRGMYIGSLDSKETKRILTTDFKAEYAAPGYLLFVQDRKLMAQPFSAERQELSGEPSIVADGIGSATTDGSAGFSVSERGALAYVSGQLRTRLSWTDRSGKPLGTIWTPDQSVNGPELSPDERRVAVETTGIGDIWVLEMGRTGFRLTSDPATDRLPRWSPDGSRILFQSDRDGGIFHLYQQPSSGAGNADVLLKDSERKYPYDWSRNGKFVAYVAFGAGERVTADIWVLPLTGDRTPFPYLTSGYQETQPRISPDGRWMAYVSNESGRDDVYITSFPTAGGKKPVSTNGGVQPRWRADGKELFYLSPDQKLMAVPLEGGSPLNVGTPQALFDVRVLPRGSEEPYAYYQYDVTADGQRFLICALPEGTTIPITVVLNWTAGLKR